MSSCIINIDNFQGQYYPGNNIIGRVICSFTKSKEIREIRLKLRGKEHNNWTGTESYYDHERKETRTRSVEYHGDNKFLSVDMSLRGSGDIGPGRFEYPFNFVLPTNLPGTYNGKYGWIRYSLKATVDIPFKSDYEDMKEFIVVAPIDFNEIKDRLELNPVVYSDDKTLCCWCCASGPITMNVHLDKEAYVQGETMNVKVDITNMANANVEAVGIKLGMTVKSRVNYPSSESKTDYELLAADNATGVGAHGGNSYNFKLQIPQSTVVPNFNLCTLFEQWTTLDVKAVLPAWHEDMRISSRIIMGHIRIGEREQYQNIPLQQSGFYAPPQNNPIPPGGIPYSPAATPYPPSDPYKPPYPTENNSTQFPTVQQTPYPPGVQLLPPTSPPPPYPNVANAAPYPTTITHPVEFPSLPPGALPPMPPPGPAPYPEAKGSSDQSGPSAPPMDDEASAPSKAELAEAKDFVMVDASAIGEGEHLLPPSYNDAVHVPPYPVK